LPSEDVCSLRATGSKLQIELSVARSRSGEPFILAAVTVARFGALTATESMVPQALRDGLSNAEIAGRMSISLSTVKTQFIASSRSSVFRLACRQRWDPRVEALARRPVEKG
jgi:DNA-binding NarL/FixJ family response regulator